MKANYHTHSEYCGHAGGTLTDYIEKACSLHLSELGFSEHAPFPGDPFGMRMSFNTLSDYVNELKTLRNTYQNQIALHIGLEIEYLDAYASYYPILFSRYDIEYLIMGQHFFMGPDKKCYNLYDNSFPTEYLIMPALTALFAALMVWVSRYEGKKSRESNARVVAGMTVWVLLLFNTMWIFFMMQALKTAEQTVPGPELSLKGILILMMASFIPLGNRMPKTQRNSLLGLRTKWSMADDVCWQKSQRLGGITMVAAGALGVALLSVLPMDWGMCVVTALLLIMTAADVAGTYLIWKRQQNK